MNLLRFTAAWTGVGSAFLYLLGLLFWERSWLAADYPWSRWLPVGVTFVLGFIVSAISFWRLTTRTLPPGGPDLLKFRFWPVERFADAWGLVAFVGFVLMLFGRSNELLGLAGFSLVTGAWAQAFIPVYEEGPDA